jgi:hypothetical protein
MYQTKDLTSLIRKGTMLDTLDKNEVAPNTPTGAPTAMTIGAELRRLVEADPASHSSTTIRRIGNWTCSWCGGRTSGRCTWLT